MNTCGKCMSLTHKTEDHAALVQRRIEIFQQAVETVGNGIRKANERIALEKERISRLEDDKVLWLAKIENLKKELEKR